MRLLKVRLKYSVFKAHLVYLIAIILFLEFDPSASSCPLASTALEADHQLFPNPSGSYATGTAVGSTLIDIGASLSPYPITAGSGVTYHGRSLKFDGSSDAWVSFGTGVVIGDRDFSISVWGMYTEFNHWARLFDFQPYESSRAGIFVSNSYSNSQLVFNLFESDFIHPTGVAWTLNQFSHVVIGCTLPNTCNIYFNGVLIYTLSQTITSQTFSYVAGLGKSSYSHDANLKGQVADFRLFSRALTQGIFHILNVTFLLLSTWYTILLLLL
jgi:hypothetical protein